MTSASPARVPLSRAAGSSHRLRLRAVPTDFLIMNTSACRAVAQAGSSAATASLDDEAELPLLLVAGWLTTAADLMIEAGHVAAALAVS